MKKALSIVLSIILLLSVVPVVTIGVSAAEDEVLEIRTIADLYSINNNMSGNYRLMNDIDMTEDTAVGGDWDFMGNGWEPLGSDGIYGNIPFMGIFDGNGHKIIGMRINRNTTPSGAGTIYLGLFAKNEGTIQNLGIDETSIVAEGDYSSGICAFNSGTVLNCYNKAAVSSSTYYSYSGGICGYNSGNISNCYNEADISAKYYSGGICGYSKSGEFKNCYNTGIIATDSHMNTPYSGGICGSTESGNIIDCYNIGDITSTIEYSKSSTTAYSSDMTFISYSYAGGICGSNKSSVNNSYNKGNIVAETTQSIKMALKNENLSAYSHSFCGGICGSSSMDISNCYNTGELSSKVSSYAENSYRDSTYHAKEAMASANSFGYSYAGGICGNQTNVAISNCYNTANVIFSANATAKYFSWGSASPPRYYYSENYRSYDGKTETFCGGIVGESNGEINGCYNVGKANYGIQETGTGSISNCYYLSSAGSSNTGAKALTSAQLQLEMCMPKFDFENTWVIDNATEYQYPQLINNRQEILPPHLLGDVDGDGEVSIIDTTCIQRSLVDIPIDPYNKSTADVDNDGVVTILDATWIQRYLIGSEYPAGIGEPIS